MGHIFARQNVTVKRGKGLCRMVSGPAKLPNKFIELLCETMNKANSMLNCNHEDADTRIVVHIHHALLQGIQKVEVHSVDTNVVVILVGVFYELLKTLFSADIAMGCIWNWKGLQVEYKCNL